MYHFQTHEIYHPNPYQQHCQLFAEQSKTPALLATQNNHLEAVTAPYHIVSTQPDCVQAHPEPQSLTPNVEKKKTVLNKSSVDTSTFSIEERLVTAVWVHERKHTKNSMSQTHEIYHPNPYQQHCQLFAEQSKTPALLATQNNHLEAVTAPYHIVSTQPDCVQAHPEPQSLTPNVEKKKTVLNKSSVDTSTFSIEERLVTAVWVHERKHTKNSMSQIKHDFRQRFGRDPPAKNTLLAWERKLFSTGSVHDAPRPGRPVNRRARMEDVAASVRAAPALSLRARALSLRVPRTTLRTILRRDLPHAPPRARETAHLAAAGKQQIKQNVKRKLQ